METPLLDRLIAYCKNPKTPFHMPAHAGGRGIMPEFLEFCGLNIFKADLTEIDELDNLSDPEGVIKETQEKIASIYDTKASYLLVNGSTAGLMTLVNSLTREGEKVLVNRNCHRSIINGLVASGAEPVWLMPEWLPEWEVFGAVLPEVLDEQLENNPEIKTVFITNPTYEGIVSDTRALATICKKYDVRLIVDEAHGGHWQFSDLLPESALNCGADAVVQSLHKSCGSLSQSSLLHISKDTSISLRTIEENLKLFQSTSPSYLLMASLDAASSYLTTEEGKAILENTYQKALNLRDQLRQNENIQLIENNENLKIDPTRLFVKVNNLSGIQLADIIEDDYHIAIESMNNKGCLFFLNIGNSESDFNELQKTLNEIASKKHSSEITNLPEPNTPVMKMSPRTAFYSDSETVRFKDAIGRTSKFPVVKCPPGVCILVPGEQVTEYHKHFFDLDDKIEIVR